jgi:hypothetical protein
MLFPFSHMEPVLEPVQVGVYLWDEAHGIYSSSEICVLCIIHCDDLMGGGFGDL